MAKKKLFKSKTNFTLKRLHQSGSYGNIYERDYSTIVNLPATSEGQIPIYGSPSFKMTVRAGLNGRKKYNYGKWVSNPKGDCDGGAESNVWTLNCMPEISKETDKIILKPNKHKITDFACFGSAYELIRSSLTDIISKFPTELYVTDKTLKNSSLIESGTIPENSDLWQHKNDENFFIVDNPLYIDITQSVIPENSHISPLRYMCESSYNYNIIDENDNVVVNGQQLKEEGKIFWELEEPINNYIAKEDCLINGELLVTAHFNSQQGRILSIYCFYYEGGLLYFCTNKGFRIRPNEKTIEKFFNDLDDFEKVLLNQYTDYTARFETYIESEEDGWYMTEKDYKWPVGNGGWNLSITGISYAKYADDLSNLALNYDELFTNAIQRNMVHESVSNMDLTNVISNELDYETEATKMKKFLNVIGRQFDEIKKYADNIKKTNNITYDQNENTPDYFLSDNLSLCGWEPKEILSNIPNDKVTPPMYGARSVGFRASDANNEFMRRLYLNSRNIFAKKGTKRGIEDLMALFGFHSVDWLKKYYNRVTDEQYKNSYKMYEYVYVANGYSNIENPDEIVEKVRRLNVLKDGYVDDSFENDAYNNEFQGIPVAEAEYDGKKRLVPWFDKNAKYDSKMYFQSKGGWFGDYGETDNDEINEPVKYDYTISKIHYVTKTEDLFEIIYSSLDEHGVYFVGNTNEYYRLKDIDEHRTIDGWELVSREEVEKINTIIETTKGNNPHGGDYDGGEHYINAYTDFFKYSNFSNVRQDEIDNYASYGFNISRQYDFTKCLYFGNRDGMENSIRNEAQLRGYNRIKPTNLFTDATKPMTLNRRNLSINRGVDYKIKYCLGTFSENEWECYWKDYDIRVTTYEEVLENAKEPNNVGKVVYLASNSSYDDTTYWAGYYYIEDINKVGRIKEWQDASDVTIPYGNGYFGANIGKITPTRDVDDWYDFIPNMEILICNEKNGDKMSNFRNRENLGRVVRRTNKDNGTWYCLVLMRYLADTNGKYDKWTQESWDEFEAEVRVSGTNSGYYDQVVTGNAYYDGNLNRVCFFPTKDLSSVNLTDEQVENFHVYVWRTQGGETIRIGEEDDVVNKVSYEEPMSLSIINSKEMRIIFDKRNRDFIESDVLPYLKQVIPASTIFSYSFEIINDDNELEYNAKIHGTICEDVCPIYGVYKEDNEPEYNVKIHGTICEDDACPIYGVYKEDNE